MAIGLVRRIGGDRLLVFVLAAVWFGVIASRTCADEDEGFYAVAGELTAHGRFVYRDFFYPQMPLVPALLAPVAGLGSFRLDRLATALVAAVGAALVYACVARLVKSRLAAAFAAVMLSAHELGWQWLPVVKTYGLASLFSLLALWWAADEGDAPPRRWILAGAAAALAPG